MKNSYVKAGLALPSMKIADVSYNVSQIEKLFLSQNDLGILLFPELSLSGYTCGDLFFQDSLLDACLEGLKKLKEDSKQKKGTLLIVGLPFRKGNALYNVAALINDGHILGFVPKSNLPNYSEFYERRWFASGYGKTNQVVSFDGEEVPFGTDLLFADEDAIVGVEICEDLFVPDKPSTHLALGGANILCNLSASDEIIGKREYRRDLVKMQSADCYCDYLYVSSGTEESSTDLVFSGQRLVGDNGTVLVDEIYPEENSIKTVILDTSKSIHNRIHQNTFRVKDSRLYRTIPTDIQRLGEKETTLSELKKKLSDENFVVARNPFLPTDEDIAKRAETILAIQAHGLVTRVRKTHLYNLVIGVSGGLDSTLALLVMKEAQRIEPKIQLIAYTMPNKGNTSSLTYRNALALMKELGCEIHEVDIHSGVAKHLKDIGHKEEYEGERDTAYENAQARMRTYILMDVANMRSGLVVGTGDLSELALGWCTYNGDHMSMYGVNASIPKTLVKYLVRAYADKSEDMKLKKTLYSILDTPITPELTPNRNGVIAQKTEEKIGKYDLNDFFLFYLLRYGYSPDHILLLASLAYPEVSLADLKTAEKRFYSRFFSQAFKRSCLPDGPKVGSLSLSPRGDYRMPSDAEVEMYLQIIDKAE